MMVAEEHVGLRDHLHHGVFDAVMHHLHEMPGAAGSAGDEAGFVAVARRDGAEERGEAIHRARRAAGHDRGAPQRALGAAGDAEAEEVHAARGGHVDAPRGVSPEGIAAVDHGVARLEHGEQFAERGIDRRSGGHEQEDRARPGQGGRERGEGCRRRGAGAEFRGERRRARGIGVEQGKARAVAREVAGEVGAHRPEADEAEGGSLRARGAAGGHSGSTTPTWLAMRP